MSAHKIKTLYFTRVDIGDFSNGGGFGSSHNIKCLSLDSSVDLTVVTAASAASGEKAAHYVRSLGLPHIHIPFVERPRKSGIWQFIRARTYIPCESEAKEQRHVNDEFSSIIWKTRPDIVVIDYLPSAMFIPSLFSSSLPRCLITLNRESEMWREFKAQGRTKQKGITRWLNLCLDEISNARTRHNEQRIFSGCAGIVALTQNDLPQDAMVKSVIPHIFDQNDKQWIYQGNRNLFFVGAINHYPNRLAMEWICTRLAPKLDKSITINIIGASDPDVPQSWRAPNIVFMGASTKEEVMRQMTTADLFVAPIANTHGAKVKLAECVSYGMPFIATHGAMSGLSFLEGIPEINLDNPAKAAAEIWALLDDPEALKKLSTGIVEQTQMARKNQRTVWGRFLGEVLAHGQRLNRR